MSTYFWIFSWLLNSNTIKMALKVLNMVENTEMMMFIAM